MSIQALQPCLPVLATLVRIGTCNIKMKNLDGGALGRFMRTLNQSINHSIAPPDLGQLKQLDFSHCFSALW